MKNVPKEWIMTVLVFILLFIDLPERKFYEEIETIQNPQGFLLLVNKNHRLKADYIPDSLLMIHETYANEGKYLIKEARDQFEQLSQDARQLGYKIVAVSAYRSFDYQKKLYEEYVKTKGLEYADLCSARPGHSEHQTGLSLDVMGSNEDYDEFAYSLEFPWMRDNAHKYGFILRYPLGKEAITGFKYEPWHYRYVGKAVAQKLYENSWTLEEYWDNIEKV